MTRPAGPSRIACSGDFVVELKPDAIARGAVIATGWLASLAGFAILLHLPVSPVLRAVFCLAWVCDSLRLIARQARGHARLRRVVVAASGLAVLGTAGQKFPVVLLSGSVLVGRLAWFRLRYPDGLCCGELLLGRTQRPGDWRRLNVLWRHAG